MVWFRSIAKGYSLTWSLSFNLSKCVHMNFKTKALSYQQSIISIYLQLLKLTVIITLVFQIPPTSPGSTLPTHYCQSLQVTKPFKTHLLNSQNTNSRNHYTYPLFAPSYCIVQFCGNHISLNTCIFLNKSNAIQSNLY